MKRRQISLFTFSIAMSVAFSSCSTSDENSDANTTVNKANFTQKSGSYTASEIFRGVYFLTGNFADELPLLKSMKGNLPVPDADQAEILKNLENEIIQEILTEDPTYFDKFSRSLETNDLYSLRAIYSEGFEKIRQAGLRTATFKETFLLANIFEEHSVDFNRPDIASLNLSKPEDFAKFNEILEREYNIQYDITQGYNHTAIASAVVHARAVAFAHNKLLAHSTAYLFNKVKWFTDDDKNIAQTDILVQEIAQYF